MRAPNSMSFLSKAYNFLKGKTSRNDENFYAKAKTPFPNEIYPILCEPFDSKGMADSSWKDRRVLGEITNRTRCMVNDRERMKQRARMEAFSPRAVVKNYWSSKEEKKINTEIQHRPNNKVFYNEGEEGEEEGVFSIQVRYFFCSFTFELCVRRMRKFWPLFPYFPRHLMLSKNLASASSYGFDITISFIERISVVFEGLIIPDKLKLIVYILKQIKMY